LMVAIPGAAITATVLSISVLGRELRRRTEGRTSP
jgi:ABC-type dipeptide/oligopeptide/nickel transport system permease subunit